MKKTSNTFRDIKTTNALRGLIIFCVVIVVGALLLLASLPSNRQKLLGWLSGGSQLTPKAVDTANNEPGLNGNATVNENLQVRPLGLDDHVWGDLNAPVQLIVYDDFQCPFCTQFYEAVQKAKTEFGAKVVVAIRHYPLTSHPQALPAAIAAECAGEQGKFFEMYHELFADNKAAKLSPEEIRANGTAIGLDQAAYEQCLTSEKYTAKILAEKEEVKKLGVIGTPASFLNKEYIAGALPYEDFAQPDGTTGKGLQSKINEKLAQ